MRARTLLTAAAVLPLLVVGSASAVGKGCQHLLVDPVGDTGVSLGTFDGDPYGVPVPSALDIVSVDLFSDAKKLKVVMRFDGDTNADPSATTGQIFEVLFDVGRKHYLVQVFRSSARSTTSLAGSPGSDGGTGAGYYESTDIGSSFSADGRTLVWTAPSSAFRALEGSLPRHGSLVKGIAAHTELSAGGVSGPGRLDRAETKNAYRAGSPSCA